MTHLSWSARTSLGLKSLAAVLLMAVAVGCGSSKKYDEFMPTRILSIGDAMSYMDLSSAGQSPNFPNVLTVSDGSTSYKAGDHWLKSFAASYGLTKISAPGGGGNIVVYNDSKPVSSDIDNPVQFALDNTLGNFKKVKEQADKLTGPSDGDLVVISIGLGDIFQRANALGNTLTNSDDATAKDIGLQYANLADSLYQRGFKHVLIVNALDFSSSPYAYKRSNVQAAPNYTPNYSANVAALTEALNKGVNVNCNGGCELGDSKPYPSRNAGVWKYNAYDLLRNVTLGLSPYLAAVINSTKPLCLPAVQNCLIVAPFTGLDTDYSVTAASGKYFYSGDLFPTPIVHQFVGANLYAYARGFSGF